MADCTERSVHDSAGRRGGPFVARAGSELAAPRGNHCRRHGIDRRSHRAVSRSDLPRDVPERAMIAALVGASVTLAAYRLNMKLYRSWRKLWLSPLLLTPVVLIVCMASMGIPYDAYLDATRPLVWMIGPLSLALAIPVYQNRSYIREWWPALLAGTLVGSLARMLSAIGLAHLFDLPASIARSLVARSVSLPFAFVVSDEVAGTRDLTALFVVTSGIVSIVAGELLLILSRFKTDQAHGAALGATAQVAGVARAHELGIPRGVMASLTMIFSGAFSALVAPLLVRIL